MEMHADSRWRLAIAARTPGLSAAALAALQRADPRLELLERPERDALARAGLTTAGIDWLLRRDLAPVESDLRWLESNAGSLLACTEPAYPQMLRDSPDPPATLYVRGNVAALSEPQIAMVGSRNPTAGGRATARDFAARFARLGLTVTSGLALGIDAACHEGALGADGLTIAVMGRGLDEIYPAGHGGLAQRIAAAGALVSEFPPGTPALAAHFPQRNRIIAGLAHGTVVVEAAQRSGSLITARLAGNAGREVFALPGSIHNPLARGCHALIRQGAKLVEDVDDVLAELKISLSAQLVASAPEAAGEARGNGPTLDKAYKILLDALAFEPASVDSLIERTGLNSESIASMLLILELDGHVAPHPG
ncbi:MAG TPA: DNA-processing protein DprA, partial [Steroidobacteraceae bacterium]|nr:DNA-processing protein DprA [Steroidobacteraceae bacterium]